MTTFAQLDASEKLLPGPALPWWKRWNAWPRRRLYVWLAAGLGCLAVIALAIGLGVHFGIKRDAAAGGATVTQTGVQTDNGLPVIAAAVPDNNFADPCYINENGRHYAFATNRYKNKQPGQIHVQIATSHDFASWTLTDTDALPDPGNWTTGAFVWAPDVVKLADGTFVLYYTAPKLGGKGRHCIGAATAATVEGPYTPLAEPLACPLPQGGAIDPEGFVDADGTRYLLYKVDGNSLDGPHQPMHPTPLMLQQMAADGVTPVGDAVTLLDRTDADGLLIEAPSLGRYTPPGADPVYILFFSSHLFSGPGYDVKYATASSIRGPYTRADQPLLRTGDGPNKVLFGPGGMDVGVSSTQVVFHSIKPGTPKDDVVRGMWTGQLTISGTTVTI